MRLHELKAKAWYRLVKVAYFLIMALVTIFVVATVVNETQPYRLISSEKSYITCSNGSSFRLYENNILADEYVVISESAAKKLCNKNSPGDNFVPLEKNFAYYPVFIMAGSWWNVAMLTLLSLIVILLVSELIRRTFYYVTVGKFFPKE